MNVIEITVGKKTWLRQLNNSRRGLNSSDPLGMGNNPFEGRISVRHSKSWPWAVRGEILSRKLDMNTFF